MALDEKPRIKIRASFSQEKEPFCGFHPRWTNIPIDYCLRILWKNGLRKRCCAGYPKGLEDFSSDSFFKSFVCFLNLLLAIFFFFRGLIFGVAALEISVAVAVV